MRKIILSILLLIPLQCFAIGITQAKNQGMVGEMANGYIGIVSSTADNELIDLVRDVNNQRKREYQAIAKRNQTSLEAVEAIAGQRNMQKTKSGHFVRSQNSGWRRK